MRPFSGLLFCLTLLLQVSGLAAPAQAAGPAPTASCVLTAQNRTAPLPADGNYAIQNLPGNGFVPNGSNGSAQPFRARAVCDDGTLGETPILFPDFESDVVYGGEIIWGQTSIKPARLQLSLPASQIQAGQYLLSSVTGFYLDGSTRDLSPRASGTGYRSSASGYIGVASDGTVFGQPMDVVWRIGGVFQAPPQVVITAENDGVVSSRVLKLVSGQEMTGTVYQADGKTPAAGVHVRLVDSDLETVSDANGKYRLQNLPAGTYWQRLLAWQENTRSFVQVDAQATYNAPATVLDLTLGGAGRVAVQVLDSAQKPLPGVDVTLADRANALQDASNLAANGVLRTDANGVVRFASVAAGTVTPVLSGNSYVSAPGNAVLTAGGELIFYVTVNDAATPVSNLTGTLRETPSGIPGVGMVVRLTELQGLQRSFSTVSTAGGRFSFEQLVPNTGYQIDILRNGILLRRDQIYAASAGQTLNLDWTYNKPSRVAGVVMNADGVTPAANVSVQLNVNVYNSWSFVKEARTNGQGQYEFAPLNYGSFRIDAIDRNGQASSGLFTVSSAGSDVSLDIRLAAERVIVTRVQLDVREPGPDYRIGNAAVYVSNSRCATACLLGSTRDGEFFLTETLPAGENRFEIRRGGRVAALSVIVDATTDGQTLQRLVVLPDSAANTYGVLKFVGQRNLMAFNALAGERLSLAATGAAVAGSRGAYAVKVELFDPARNLLASASGFGFGGGQGNLSRIDDLLLERDGTYGIVVTTNNDSLDLAGGYWIDLLVNGQARTLQAFAPAGVVQGTLSGTDSAPLAGRTVELSGKDAMNVRQRMLTGDTGQFRFESVPLGELQVSVMQNDQELARNSGRLENDGQLLNLNLTLGKVTNLNVSVEIPGGQNLPQMLDVQLRDDLGTRSIGAVYFWGGNRSTTVAAIAVGDSFTLFSQHPSQPGLHASQTLAGADGQTLYPLLVMNPGALTGRVLYADGSPAPYVQVVARSASDNQTLEYETTDGSGNYRFTRLPPAQNLIIAASDYTNRIESTVSVPGLTGQDQSAPDLRLIATGTISALVRYSNGDPIANAVIEIDGTVEHGVLKLRARSMLKPTAKSLVNAGGVQSSTVPVPPPGTFSLFGNTDDSGRFSISGVPVGPSVTVQATTPLLPVTQQQSASLSSAGQVLNLPDFVFPGGTALVISLLDGDGKPNQLVQTASIGECGPNKVLVQTSAGPVVLSAAQLQPLLGVPAGPVLVQLYDGCTGPYPETDVPLASASTVITGDGVYPVTVLVPIISGTVKLTDGRTTSYPEVTLTQVRQDGKTKRLFSATSDYLQRQRGIFNLVGVDLGDFGIAVQDNSHGGLSASVAGHLERIANLNLNVLLDAPPYDGSSSEVQGKITQGGVAVQGAGVSLFSGGNEYYTQTDADGIYILSDVPAGSFTMTVNSGDQTVQGSGESGSAPVVRLDLSLPEPLQRNKTQKARQIKPQAPRKGQKTGQLHQPAQARTPRLASATRRPHPFPDARTVRPALAAHTTRLAPGSGFLPQRPGIPFGQYLLP